MRDLLRDLLSPSDDGSGFIDAVLLRASGALARRRAAADAADVHVPAFGWLERWARPWLVAALMLMALAALAPALPWGAEPRVSTIAPADSDAMTQSLLPADLAVAVATEGR